ncbi:hypothetical protein QI406_07840, partial [Staphylococcus aureus]|nr:hypothetical protein [Staphylococcus aureus]
SDFKVAIFNSFTDYKVKSRFGCIWHGDSKETVLENERAFLAELEHY